jgi:Transposase DDE domain/Transposase domain (DUF772)
MTLGRAPEQGELGPSSATYCDGMLSPTSIYGLLYRECHHLFPDDAFADLFANIGRESVPPRIVAVVMVLQRLEGLSDREAMDRFTFDVRWKYAAGGLPMNYPSFVHTVLVGMRARLRASEAPDRIFRIVLDVARKAGAVGRRRVLDSTPLYDAVATQDTVTMIRSAIRGLLRVVDEAPARELATELRGVLQRQDDYATAGKPVCEWEDKAAREALVDALARDARAVLAHLDGRELPADVNQAAELLATVVGQDLEQAEDGHFRIARRVAKDRVISTVDPEARHGHKTAARGYDGYKGNIALDPDSEIITAAATTAANVGDGSVAKELLADLVPMAPQAADVEPTAKSATEQAQAPTAPEAGPGETGVEAAAARDVEPTTTSAAEDGSAAPNEPAAAQAPPPVEVYGDASYGTAEILRHLEANGAAAMVKVQAPVAHDGHFSKDAFVIDLDKDTVTCPANRLVQIRRHKDGSGTASFGVGCKACPMASSCTDSKEGRSIQINKDERLLHGERERQKSPEWRRKYKATRPKVERKLAHLMRRRHGGRRARMRGRERVAQDFTMLCAAVNLQRLAQLGLRPVDALATPAAA